MKRWIHHPRWLAGCAAICIAALLAACGGSSTSSSSKSGNSKSSSSSAVLTVESSQQNSITKNFNPYVPSSAATLLGATSLVYEPLIQFNAIKPGQQYNWLATSYTWSNERRQVDHLHHPSGGEVVERQSAHRG